MKRSDRATFGRKARSYSRADRVGNQLQEVLAEHLERDGGDSLDMITITGVDCSPDLRNATVFFTIYGDVSARPKAEAALLARAKKLRMVVGKSVRLKYTPDLKFEFDDSIERGNRIETVLKDLKEES